MKLGLKSGCREEQNPELELVEAERASHRFVLSFYFHCSFYEYFPNHDIAKHQRQRIGDVVPVAAHAPRIPYLPIQMYSSSKIAIEHRASYLLVGQYLIPVIQPAKTSILHVMAEYSLSFLLLLHGRVPLKPCIPVCRPQA